MFFVTRIGDYALLIRMEDHLNVWNMFSNTYKISRFSGNVLYM